MAIAITIPRLGWNMDQGVFVGWLKRDGDTIRAGEPLFTLEGEKAAQDIEANDPGILRIAPSAPAAGEVVAVGTVIGYLTGPDESEDDVPREGEAIREGEPPGEPDGEEARQEPRPPGVGRLRISPLARR